MPGKNIMSTGSALFRGIGVYGRMIKFSHSVFALPFALSAVVLAAGSHCIEMAAVFWIIMAMVTARSAAMGFNRIVDAPFDKENPRTKRWELPAGQISLRSAVGFVLASSVLFIFAAFMLGGLCGALAVPALAVLFGYSYTKRFTRWCHLYLGGVISMAPMGAWIAVTNTFSWGIFALCLALMTYIAGFDMIYACMDIKFDRARCLFSVPAISGVRPALWFSAGLHLASLGFLAFLYLFFDMGWIYLTAVFAIAVLYAIEHLLVKPDDMRAIHVAFFHVNSVISVVLFVGIAMDKIISGRLI